MSKESEDYIKYMEEAQTCEKEARLSEIGPVWKKYESEYGKEMRRTSKLERQWQALKHEAYVFFR